MASGSDSDSNNNFDESPNQGPNIPCDKTATGSESDNCSLGSEFDSTELKTVEEVTTTADSTPVATFGRRLSCEGVKSILIKIKELIKTPLDLPKNKAENGLFDCNFFREIDHEDPCARIDRYTRALKDWADECNKRLKAHVETHQFTEEPVKIRGVSGRRRGSLPENYRVNVFNIPPDKVDSGYDSKEIPSLTTTSKSSALIEDLKLVPSISEEPEILPLINQAEGGTSLHTTHVRGNMLRLNSLPTTNASRPTPHGEGDTSRHTTNTERRTSRHNSLPGGGTSHSTPPHAGVDTSHSNTSVGAGMLQPHSRGRSNMSRLTPNSECVTSHLPTPHSLGVLLRPNSCPDGDTPHVTPSLCPTSGDTSQSTTPHPHGDTSHISPYPEDAPLSRECNLSHGPESSCSECQLFKK